MLFDCLKDEICVRRKYTNCADELSWVAAHVHNPRQIVLKWKVKHLNEWVKGIKNWNKDQADRMRGRGGVTPFSLTKLLNLRIFSYLIMNMNRDTKGQILEVFDWGRSWKKAQNILLTVHVLVFSSMKRIDILWQQSRRWQLYKPHWVSTQVFHNTTSFSLL